MADASFMRWDCTKQSPPRAAKRMLSRDAYCGKEDGAKLGDADFLTSRRSLLWYEIGKAGLY